MPKNAEALGSKVRALDPALMEYVVGNTMRLAIEVIILFRLLMHREAHRLTSKGAVPSRAQGLLRHYLTINAAISG